MSRQDAVKAVSGLITYLDQRIRQGQTGTSLAHWSRSLSDPSQLHALTHQLIDMLIQQRCLDRNQFISCLETPSAKQIQLLDAACPDHFTTPYSQLENLLVVKHIVEAYASEAPGVQESLVYALDQRIGAQSQSLIQHLNDLKEPATPFGDHYEENERLASEFRRELSDALTHQFSSATRRIIHGVKDWQDTLSSTDKIAIIAYELACALEEDTGQECFLNECAQTARYYELETQFDTSSFPPDHAKTLRGLCLIQSCLERYDPPTAKTLEPHLSQQIRGNATMLGQYIATLLDQEEGRPGHQQAGATMATDIRRELTDEFRRLLELPTLARQV